MRSGLRLLALATGLWLAAPAVAGFQSVEALAASVAAGLRQAVTRATPPRLVFDNAEEGRAWLLDMSGRLARRVPDNWMRERLLTVIHYEASRAGLDPATVELARGFDRILYISCNQETLRDNVLALAATHLIAASAVFDQFPYTHHLECGVVLVRR